MEGMRRDRERGSNSNSNSIIIEIPLTPQPSWHMNVVVQRKDRCFLI